VILLFGKVNNSLLVTKCINRESGENPEQHPLL